MKTFKCTLLTIVLVSYLISDAPCQKEVSSEEKSKAVSHLSDSKEELIGLVKDLNDTQWHFKPAPDIWSVAEICEHLVLVETKFFNRITEEIVGSDKQNHQTVALQDDELMTLVQDRTNKVKTQPPFEPSGKFNNPKKFIEHFKSMRTETISYLGDTNNNLRAYVASFSPKVGDIDAYQWFLFLAGHNFRHNAQIKEVLNHQKFPQ